MSNTSSLSQDTTSLAIRNRPGTQGMVAANAAPSTAVAAVTGTVLSAVTQVDHKLERLLCLDDATAAKVANAAAIVKMQVQVATVDFEKERIKEDVRNNDGYHRSKVRKERMHIDRIEGLLEILMEERTMPATNETRALFAKKIEQFEKAHKARRARSDAEVLQAGPATPGPYSSD
ncbi:hypothetical protein B0T13DRAFT_534190 [Neurospora crassa]|nr:hypothetical protein B0T13DRAFT_534190 [Neurospora crassa]